MKIFFGFLVLCALIWSAQQGREVEALRAQLHRCDAQRAEQAGVISRSTVAVIGGQR